MTIRAVFSLCLLSLPAAAQAQDAPPPPTGGITFTGSIRDRQEFWDYFGGKGENTYTFNGVLAQFAVSRDSSTFDWKIDFAAPILLGLPSAAIAPAPQGQLGLGANYYANNHASRFAALVFPKELYARWKTEHARLQVGRFEFAEGREGNPASPTLNALKRDRIQQRLIGTFAFSYVQRSFDGGHLSFANGPWTITAVGAIPTRGVFQVDGWGWVKTPFAYIAATHELKYSARNSAEFRAFGIYYEDPRGVLKTDNRPLAVRSLDRNDIRLGTYGGHYIQALQMPAATFDLLAWGAWQSGAWGNQTQRAGAYALEAGVQPAVLTPVRPWLRGGYFESSGDGNSKDGIHGTFFALLPTPRIYARYPFFNEMNNRDAFAELILRPSKKITTRFDAHHLALTNKNDLWYSGGGAFQPWTFGYTGRPANGKTNLANLYDASLDYAFNRPASVGFYYGYAQGGDVIKAIYKHQDSPYGFIELSYRF